MTSSKFFQWQTLIYIFLLSMLAYLAASPFLKTGAEKYIMYFFGTLMLFGLVVVSIAFMRIAIVKLLKKR